jgi:hypothetical protein
MRRWLARTVVAALLLGPLGIRVAVGQTTGSIEGIIRDVTGGTLPAANVLVSSASLQGSRVTRTGRDGRFWLPALPPGIYTVTATVSGFRPDQKVVTVSLDAKATVDFVLEPAVQEALSVSGASPLIDFTSTTGGTNYTSRTVLKLPVARNYADIARANPAVGSDRGDTQGRGISLTVYGATSAENQWIIDGINTTNVFKGQQGKAMSSEFVEEVEIKTDGYSAEYGRALGGVINVVTKSGGNTLHGDGFVYFDSDATFAEQIFTEQDEGAKDMRVADYHRFDYGVDLGGYILKDRLWFFGAYNRVNLSGNVSRVVPSPLVSTDDKFPLDLTDNLYSGKLTWNLASSTSIVATVFADPSTKSGAAGADPRDGPADLWVTPILNPNTTTWSSERHFGGTDFGLRASQLLGSTGLVTLQVSHHKDRNELTAVNQIRIEDWTCEGGTPTEPCGTPSSAIGARGGYGWIDGDLANNGSHREQYRADATFYAANHELKAGADFQDGHTDMTYRCSGGQCVELHNEHGTPYYLHVFSSRGRNDFTPLDDARFRSRALEPGAYLQDSWKPAGGLTVNVGLRWDAEYLDDYRGVNVLRIANEWQPRLGVVWDPWKDGRTKVYASAGRFYYSLPTASTTWWFGNVTGMNTVNHDPIDTTPDPTATPDYAKGFQVFFGGGPFAPPVDAHLKGTYQDEYTAGVERLLDPTFTVGVKGTYRRLGAAIEDRCDLDYNVPENNENGCAVINPGSSEKYAHGDFYYCTGLEDTDTAVENNCNPDDHSLRYGAPATPAARRLYRGIEVLARKTLGSRLWIQASYTYSSLRGNYDGGINERFLGVHAGANDDFNFPAEWHNSYGRLNLDRPHRFRLDGYWVTPLRLSVGVQGYVESGAPLDKLGYLCCGFSPIQLVPRGSAGRLPTTYEANLTLGYPITVGPATVTLQAYAYNLINRQIRTGQDVVCTNSPPHGYPATIYDPNPTCTNGDYGKGTDRQSPRLFRAAVRVSF